MSLSADRHSMVCDGPDCDAICPLPVALHPAPASQIGPMGSSGEGWLFAHHQGIQRHYCPRCAGSYLLLLSESNREPAVPRGSAGKNRGSSIAMETTIGQLVAQRSERARVFEKYDIDYCGGGNKSLAQVCQERQLEPQVLLADLEPANGEPILNNQDWLQRSLAELADHIILTHHAYLREALPRLSFLIGKVGNAHGKRHPELARLAVLFADLRAEMETHTEKEEQILFPLCKEIEAGTRRSRAVYIPLHNIIFVMESEHDHVGQTLATIRALTHDYQPPADACPIYRVMLDGLAELEMDMHRHIHKENNILFPRVVTMEAEHVSAS